MSNDKPIVKIDFRPKIICDTRELNSGVIKALEKLGCDYSLETMQVGDYQLSDRCCVERKVTEDFLATWLERRELFGQLIDLAKGYERPLLIIEGIPEDLYTLRRINPRALEGVLDAITVSLRIPIIYTLNSAETAQRLYHIAEREQNTEDKRYFSWHGKRSHLSSKEQKAYIVSAIPGIGRSTAETLLMMFGSVEAVMSAPKEKLMALDGIGEVTAGKMREICGGQY